MLTPVLLEMTGALGSVGAGFGAFEEVYHIFEPDELMQPKYINQAHNDWVQFVIEGGVLGLVLLGTALAFLLRFLRALWTQHNVPTGSLALWSALLLIVAVASLVDYPLRTPLGQFIGVLCIVALLNWQPRFDRSGHASQGAKTELPFCQPKSIASDDGEPPQLRRLLVCLGVFGLTLSACSGPRSVGLAESIQVTQVDSMPEPQTTSVPGISPFEELEILVVGIEDISGTYVADESARIFFPHIGAVHLSGLSANEAARRLSDRLRGDFLKHPQVRVLRNYRPTLTVSVGGQVNRPGAYEVGTNYSLLRAVNDAGGLGEVADVDDVLVLRTVDRKNYVGVYNLRAIARGNYVDPKLFPGDVVMVGENGTRRMIFEAVKLVPFVSSFVVLINRL